MIDLILTCTAILVTTVVIVGIVLADELLRAEDEQDPF